MSVNRAGAAVLPGAAPSTGSRSEARRQSPRKSAAQASVCACPRLAPIFPAPWPLRHWNKRFDLAPVCGSGISQPRPLIESLLWLQLSRCARSATRECDEMQLKRNPSYATRQVDSASSTSQQTQKNWSRNPLCRKTSLQRKGYEHLFARGWRALWRRRCGR
jgi:hypothetical protein